MFGPEKVDPTAMQRDGAMQDTEVRVTAAGNEATPAHVRPSFVRTIPAAPLVPPTATQCMASKQLTLFRNATPPTSKAVQVRAPSVVDTTTPVVPPPTATQVVAVGQVTPNRGGSEGSPAGVVKDTPAATAATGSSAVEPAATPIQNRRNLLTAPPRRSSPPAGPGE
jgi:hypothetical protein